MAATKVTDADLRAYLDAGHTQAEAARHFRVSEAAITQRLKRLRQLSSRVATSDPSLDADQNPLMADARVERLQQVIEGRLAWATDIARRDGADLVDTVFRLAAEIRRDLALHLSVGPGSGPDTLGTIDGNRT